MMHVARGELRKETNSDGAAGKRFRGKFLIFTELLQNERKITAGRKLAMQNKAKNQED